MILRKPYAFFIKMFKPIHLVIGLLIGFLMMKESKIFSFLDSNITTNLNLVGRNIKNTYVSSSLYLIPILLIVLFIGILAIMFNKKKPITFYVISIFSVIAILIINIYTINFFNAADKAIVSIKTVKLIHDLVFISMFIEGILLIFVIIRGAGVNIQKFNFDSDISKIDIKESDNEEFEVNIKFNIDKTRREHNRRIRYLKYAYAENKLLVNIVAVVIILLIIGLTLFIINSRPKVYNEKNVVITNNCSIIVENSYIVNKSYEGNKITDNYLIVVDAKIRLNYDTAHAYFNDFNISTKKAIYTPTKMYNKYLIDLGSEYIDDKLTTEYSNYIFVYEIPKKNINNKFTLTYNDGLKLNYIRLNPNKIDTDNEVIETNIGDELSFTEKLKGISLKINEYDINDEYILNYSYCISSTDCINSIERIRGIINKTYDKNVIKLNIDYKSESELGFSQFTDLLKTYGYIEYKIGDVIKSQRNIDEIKSYKAAQKNIIYLDVNKEIKDATEISFVFNIRNKKYVYRIK